MTVFIEKYHSDVGTFGLNTKKSVDFSASPSVNLGNNVNTRTGFNVKMFGAKGDGSADDTGAIQLAVDAVIAISGGTVFFPAGHYMLKKFTNLTYRSAITIDSGKGLKDGQPILVNLEGAVPVNCSTLNILTTPNSYPAGSAVIDGSMLDVLQYGLYKQGRMFFVPPKNAATYLQAMNAVYLRVANMVLIPPVYCSAGSGASYTIQGYGTNRLFINGDSVSSNLSHFSFVNGIDAWMASGLTVEGVSVQSAIAALNPNGNQYAGGGGIHVLGSAAGFVYPYLSNQGNNIARELSTFDIPIGAFFSSHVSCNQLYVQNSRIAVYNNEGGHGCYMTRINVQATNFVVQHALLAQLTTTFSGATPYCYDPKGDVYAMAGQTFPSAASTGSMTIASASIETPLSAFLNDDTSNPLTLVADVEGTGTITPSTIWGSGANLMVNFIDTGSHGQQTLNGTTVGTVKYSQTGKTPWDKHFVAYLNGYQNSTGTPQTITFWVPYNNTPAVMKDDTSGASTSATILTLPANMGAPITGYIILEGY